LVPSSGTRKSNTAVVGDGLDTGGRIGNMPPVEGYIKKAPELLQMVLNEYAKWAVTGHIADMPAKLRTLSEKAFRYRSAKMVGDNRRELNLPRTEQEADEETTSRKEFAIAFKEHDEITKHSWMSK
jgi:hypothetical protein